jgi:hypothetical protein
MSVLLRCVSAAGGGERVMSGYGHKVYCVSFRCGCEKASLAKQEV